MQDLIHALKGLRGARFVTGLSALVLVAGLRYASLADGVIGALVIAGIGTAAEALERTRSRRH